MAFSNTYIIPNASSEGTPLPPRGATGRTLWTVGRNETAGTILDTSGYPGQQFVIRETLDIAIEAYKPELISLRGRFFIPKRYLGTYQIIDSTTNDRITHEGDLGYGISTIILDSTFVLAPQLTDGQTIYGEIEMRQCNMVLQPSGTVQVRKQDQQTTFPNYSPTPQAGALLKGRYSIDRAYPISSQPVQLPLTKVGLFLYEGASVIEIGYNRRQINSIAGSEFLWTSPACSLT